jgi:hypothetical protein
MRVQSLLFIAASLTLALLTACGDRGERETATTEQAPAADAAERTEPPGTTTSFEEPTPEPEQPAGQ